ncbi:hypothetical protein [Salinarimonas rosea]|nr:hypothetical protein [Salinarimonas rosea]
MAKGQMRGNKEVRKPKTKKEPAAAPTGFAKGNLSPAAASPPKKKG